jgi:two-component system phosphate regulon sensor histidine kinase PhoR
MFKKIHWRIALPNILLILVGLLALGLYVANFIESIYLTNLEDRLSDEARLISEQLIDESELWTDFTALDERAKRWADVLDARVTVITADGTVVGESNYDRAQMENHLNRPEVIEALELGDGVSTRFSSTVGFRMIYIAHTVRVADEVVGFVRLSVALTQVDEYLTSLRRTMIGAALMVTFLAMGLAILIAQGVTRPLRTLTHKAQRVAVNENSWREHTRIPIQTHDEIGILTEAINEMVAQLGNKIEALRGETGKLNAVLNQMTDGMLIVDPAGIVQLMNPAAEQLFKTSQSQAIGRLYSEVVRHHQLMDIFNRCQTTGEVQIVVLDLPLSRLYLQGIATSLGDALPGSTLLVFQDLTQLHRLETVRRDFISNISHELRTPIASLKVITETLLDGALDDLEMARRFLTKMDTEVDALSLMVSELLELSRIESGKVPLVLKQMAPGEILTAANERLRLQAERAGLTVELRLPPGLPLVLVDPPRIEQVLVNLVHNAIKFTPQGGIITMAVDVSTENPSAPVVQFSVADTGVGISDDDLPRIFERFYKADRARSRGGTGLGLAIARHIIELHHGQIWAESREGVGSTFYFSIPLTTN